MHFKPAHDASVPRCRAQRFHVPLPSTDSAYKNSGYRQSVVGVVDESTIDRLVEMAHNHGSGDPWNSRCLFTHTGRIGTHGTCRNHWRVDDPVWPA